MNREGMRELFLSEARERLGACFDMVAAWGDEAATREQLLDVMRHAHSLKGMAATLGFSSMVELTHAIEDLIERSGADENAADWPWAEWIGDGLVTLGAIVDAVERGEDTESERARRHAGRLRAFLIGGSPGDGAGPPRLPQPPPRPAGPLRRERQAEDPFEPLLEAVRNARSRYSIDLELTERDPDSGVDPTVRVLGNLASLGHVVRVHPPKLDVQSGAFDRHLVIELESELELGELEQVLDCIAGLARCHVAHSTAPRPIERDHQEPVSWVRVSTALLDAAAEQSLETLLQIERARRVESPAPGRWDRLERQARQTYELLAELRLVPFGSIQPRLEQTARQLSSELDKPLDLAVVGGDARIDRALLESLRDPLLHLVRNAADHGIEDAALRRAAGKPAEGRIRLRVRQQGERLAVAVEDDGRGIDGALLRKRAVERGLITADVAARMDERQALQLAAYPGFSTREEVSEISGRGLGMDIVRRDVVRAGGRLLIQSRMGKGTRVLLDLPLHQALIRALVVQTGGQPFAVPVGAVRRVVEGAGHAQLGAERLSDRLRLDAADDGASRLSTLVLEEPPNPRAWVVDQIVGERDLLVQPLGPPLNAARTFVGAALLDDGTIVPVLATSPHRGAGDGSAAPEV